IEIAYTLEVLDKRYEKYSSIWRYLLCISKHVLGSNVSSCKRGFSTYYSFLFYDYPLSTCYSNIDLFLIKNRRKKNYSFRSKWNKNMVFWDYGFYHLYYFYILGSRSVIR